MKSLLCSFKTKILLLRILFNFGEYEYFSTTQSSWHKLFPAGSFRVLERVHALDIKSRRFEIQVLETNFILLMSFAFVDEYFDEGLWTHYG